MFCRRFICNCTQRNYFNTYKRPFYTIHNYFTNKIDNSTNLFKNQVPNLYTVKRFKHKKKETLEKLEVFEDEDENERVTDPEPYEKVLSRIVPSMRLDAIVKAGLGMARNKVDVAFYESKIRMNGSKVLKKSIEVNEGDEVDLVVGKSPDNPDFIIVHRIKVLSADFVSAGYKVKLVRDKSLLIEDYKDEYSSR